MSDLAATVSEAHAAGGIRVIEVPTPAERSRQQRVDVRAAVDAALASH
jgi:2-keto-3-deoxy-6-phosphogluconate aldolase